MPLTDRPEFQAWLEYRYADQVGRRHGDRSVCDGCGAELDPGLPGLECLVCLAEEFGIATAEIWLAQAVAGLVRVASDPPRLARVLAELIVHARDLTDDDPVAT